MIYTLLNAVADTTAGSTQTLASTRRDGTGIFQVDISATASVNLEGRLSESAAWAVIDTFTSSGAKVVALFPFMRANPTANSGTVSAWLSD